MNRNFMKEIYKDFFVDDLTADKSSFSNETSDVKADDTINIDDLLLKEESKELLKKIVEYMKRYSENKEDNYISFDIILETTDETTIKEVLKILEISASKYSYISNTNTEILSLYKVINECDITSAYNCSSIIAISDLNAFNMNDENFKKRFLYLFKEELNKPNITILTGEKSIINDFLFNDSELESDYFIFKLIGENPSVNDVYNEMLLKLDDLLLKDEIKIKLLDYITNTYENSGKDYNSYINNLYKYISFNKKIPEIEKVKSIDEIFKELNELVGLNKVKTELNKLVDLITLKDKTKDDLKINNLNLHMVFLGNPGTGKTTVARLIGEILYNLKYIKQNKVIEVSSKDLIAEYVGQTAIKTMGVIEKALGGILFIDEAYSLSTKNNDNSYNAECIATLIKAMEDYRDNLVVIFAGYTKEMQDFLDSNSGIVSRIGYTFEFDDYTTDELKQIFINMANKSGFEVEKEALDVLDNIIEENRNMKNFGNARFVRNIFEKTIINHAFNTKNNRSKKILKTITKEDIKY